MADPGILSRVKTVTLGLKNLSSLGLLAPNSTVTLDIIGAEDVECGHVSRISEFTKRIEADLASQLEWKNLIVRFIGPSVPISKAASFQHVPQSEKGCEFYSIASVSVVKMRCGYEELSSVAADVSEQKSADPSVVDAINAQPTCCFAFNAGIWGYPSWQPAISAMAENEVPCIITAYSLEESEDDEDTLREFKETAKQFSCVWEAEENPGRSTALARKCPTTGRSLFENAAWLCVQWKS